ncbi:hypothetical protein HPP92_007968 [Vanilla planifolia]|uniref:Uncharacterized protein n=1 Tax=Vanilla planifolia TaxID=51239 RepID=A0A835V8A6_VANPL|nr:hypothetical protein HPP92_007968 [Vanilla planifolia]
MMLRSSSYSTYITASPSFTVEADSDIGNGQMSTYLSACGRVNLLGDALLLPRRVSARSRRSDLRTFSSPDSNGGDSYLDMWRKAVDRQRKFQEFLNISGGGGHEASQSAEESKKSLERKTELFNQILDVPKEERDRTQRLQIIDRAAAAIAAARTFLRESPPAMPSSDEPQGLKSEESFARDEVVREIVVSVPQKQGNTRHATPGPDFWSWSPPQDTESQPSENASSLQSARPSSRLASHSINIKDHSTDLLSLPFESAMFKQQHVPLLPPLQSALEIARQETDSPVSERTIASNEDTLGVVFSRNAEEAAEAIGKSNEGSFHGVNPNGSKWWRHSGVEQRPDGVSCKWTLIRGVSADGTIEWEDKFWEASGRFNYKELGSEKSGRDADGNVWREYWRESMWQDLPSGLTHIEKTADKWGKNGKSDEWQEKWWEHYDDSGQTEKWAHKWCCIDPKVPLEAGHAHIWHERWGEKYDGHGGSMKYTDKWAERSEGHGWSKWGDKWDEHFDPNHHGVKQGETWWEGQHGDRWNRTWGERHDGSGWVHKYGKSSSGEHWDTRVEQDTWYERYPHFGFQHCFENSSQLRDVGETPQAA